MQIQPENFTSEFFISRGESKFFPGLPSSLFYFLPLDLLLRAEEREENVVAALYTFPINLLLLCIKDHTKIQTQRCHKATFAFYQFLYQDKLHPRIELSLWNSFFCIIFTAVCILCLLDFLSFL